MAKQALPRSKYEAIKLLIKSGATVTEISQYMEVCAATIYRVRDSESYEDFQLKRRNAAFFASMNKKKEEAEKQQVEEKTKAEESPANKTDIVASNYQLNRIAEMIKGTNEILTIMSNKIAFIVDELTK